MKFLIRYHKTSGNNTYLTDDAKMIKKICELYLNVLVTLPKVKSNLPHLLGSDSTKLSLVAPSED